LVLEVRYSCMKSHQPFTRDVSILGRSFPADIHSADDILSFFYPCTLYKHSNTASFFSFHPNDPLAAARRLANYWKKRKEIFQERVFLPINLSGNGALTVDDVRILRTGYTLNLPRDRYGRTVLYMDNSKKHQEDIPSLHSFLVSA
jgi:hypothetical protein